MIFVLSIIVGFFCAVLFWWYSKYRREWKYVSQVPGPDPMFLLGNVLDLPGRKDMIPKLMEWTKKYGTIMRFHTGPKCMYLVSDVKLLETILTSQSLLRKADAYRFVMPWLGTGLLTSTGEKWRTHRKIITPTFHFKILEQFIEVFHSNCEVLLKKLEQEVGKDSFDVYPYITMCALDTICETAMGVNVQAQKCTDSEYVKSVRTMLRISSERTFSAAIRFDSIFYFTRDFKNQEKALKILHGFTDSVINTKKSELLNSKEENKKEDEFGVRKKMAFLDLLLQASVNGQQLSDLDIREEVDTFMFEGHDTTAGALSFALFAIANHSEIQAKILEEQNAIFGGDMERGATYAELQGMRYLDMVIKETLRIYPSVPLIGREVVEDMKYENYTFVKGSIITLFTYAVGMDPKNFPNPEKFDPERFSQANSKERDIYSYVPFSAGPRNCIGQKFALLEMKSFLSSILRRYEFLPAVPKHELQFVVSGVMSSENGVCVRIKNRLDKY